MSEPPEMSICESKFAKTDKTDVILVVEGKKLHVNKALLSYHSDYFNTLFNGEFEEKSMAEIPIEDVKYEDFATLLSQIQDNPIKPTEKNAENILELADRFLLPCVKPYLEFILIHSTKSRLDIVRIGAKYQLNELLKEGLDLYKTTSDFRTMKQNPIYQSLPDKSKLILLNRFMNITRYDCRYHFDEEPSEEDDIDLFDDYESDDDVPDFFELNGWWDEPPVITPPVIVYNSTFAQTDKTDVILVVEGKKLHVNKAILSFHSDYFNTLFNGEFKEKSMAEIPIEDVKFNDFAAFLHLVLKNPVKPTEQNAENLLELADRFLVSTIKPYLELILIHSTKDRFEKVQIGDKYRLNDLLMNGVALYKSADDFRMLTRDSIYQKLSDMSKVALLSRFMDLKGYD